MDEPVIESFIVEQGQLKDTFEEILKSFYFNCKFGNLNQDIERLQEQLYKQISRLKSETFEIQIIKTPFIRGKGAYIVGKIISQLHNDKPLLIALLNNKKNGLYVDSLLTDTGSIAVVFSFSRSYFFITTDYPAAIVDYLLELMPGKTRAVLYLSLIHI